MNTSIGSIGSIDSDSDWGRDEKETGNTCLHVDRAGQSPKKDVPVLSLQVLKVAELSGPPVPEREKQVARRERR